ncbi:GGDEF domain-containing protein [Asticcacaulis biprosthecium]|uniref:GGDEF domain-containing protein n=1 Tax=Asticcacaulis biprosthecium TaxID=76891 RepID=UPI00058E4E5F|nr:GGDEF domain-containing protein [Asticcacaulis biprosthecium]
MALRTEGLHKRKRFTVPGLGLLAHAKFELALLALLLLTAAAVIGKDKLLDRTLHFTPASTAQSGRVLFVDSDAGGKSTINATASLTWDCELRAGHPYPYCGYELFTDANKGSHGLNLSNMRSVAITMMYRGGSTSFRLHMKNFDARYSVRADDESPKYLRVEADTTPGVLQRTEFVAADFGVADWWMRKHKLAPEFGRVTFDNITSLIIETGTEAPLGHHEFEVRDIEIRTAILSEAQFYSLVLGIWVIMIVLYLGYRISNLRRADHERRVLAALTLSEAQEAARRDHLTGILNRRGLIERFDGVVEHRRGPVALAVILIDIDHFKKLNDTFGHTYGDRVLTDVATVISRNVRVVDMVARWGGEEFIVVCADNDRRGAQRVAEKIRDCIENFDFGQSDQVKPGQVTASFGIHWSNTETPNLADLVERADTALCAAKASGRNCVRTHRPAMSKAA